PAPSHRKPACSPPSAASRKPPSTPCAPPPFSQIPSSSASSVSPSLPSPKPSTTGSPLPDHSRPPITATAPAISDSLLLLTTVPIESPPQDPTNVFDCVDRRRHTSRLSDCLDADI